MERLQKVLAKAGIASRRAAEQLILEGRVRVNGTVVQELGSRVDPSRDAVKVDGRRIPAIPTTPVYLMLNKPRGYVTTLRDPQRRPTVLDLVKEVKRRVYPVGRLDFNSEGLLLLTDDGDLARDLMHPRSHVRKTYLVKVRGRPDPATLERLARGIVLEGRRTLPAEIRMVRPEPNSWLEVTVMEGRKHQVRNMLRAVGHPVAKLKRIGYAGLSLGDLSPGAMRALTSRERAALKRASGSAPSPPTRRRRQAHPT